MKLGVLALFPSILVRIRKDNGFLSVFSFSKTGPQSSSLSSYLEWLLLILLCLGFHAPAGQDCIFSLQWKEILTVMSRLGLLLSPFAPEVPHYSELFSRCSEDGFRCSEIELCYNEHSLPRLIYLHLFWGFSAPFVHFHNFCNLQEKYIITNIKMTTKY